MEMPSYFKRLPKPEGVQFYRSRFLRLWQWRIIENGKVIAQSFQGFWDRADCESNLLETSEAIKEYYFNEKY